MPRKWFVLAVCLIPLLAGCRKKVEPEKPEAGQAAEIVAPAGMVQIPGAAKATFISSKAVSIGDYVAYLNATGQDAPESLKTEGVDPNKPVSGLALRQARDFAAWQLVRLPTKGEWPMASSVVGAVPYPWAEELGLDESRQDAQLFCVRDWTEGSAGEKAAKEAKQDLEGKLKAQLIDGIARLGEQLAVKAAVPSGLQEKLVQVKPGLFAAVQQKRELAEASARQERQRNVLEILGGLGQKKKRLVSLKVTQPDDLEKAVKDYDKLLSDQVNRVQSLKEDLDKKNQAAQARSMELKKQVEETLQHASEKWSSDVQPALEEAKTAPENLEKAVQLRDRLKKELEKLSKTEERIKETLRLAEAGAKEAEGGKRRLSSLAASEADTSQEITQLEEAIEKLNEHIGQQFPQETRLLKDLEELTVASARNSGFSTEIEELQKVLNSFSESSGKP